MKLGLESATRSRMVLPRRNLDSVADSVAGCQFTCRLNIWWLTENNLPACRYMTTYREVILLTSGTDTGTKLISYRLTIKSLYDHFLLPIADLSHMCRFSCQLPIQLQIQSFLSDWVLLVCMYINFSTSEFILFTSHVMSDIKYTT